LQGRLYCRSELSVPWSTALPAAPLAHFHVVDRGGYWLRLAGEPRPVALAARDLVVLPHGHSHQLSSTPEAEPIPLAGLLPPRESDACHVLRQGGGGPETTLICGSFSFAEEAGHPLLARLPEVLYLRGDAGRVADWLEPMLRFLAAETSGGPPGSEMVVNRIVAMIFIQALRAWMATQPGARAGWLGAPRARAVARALE
jgi:hypothetical protein